jgi:hypothetical protein
VSELGFVAEGISAIALPQSRRASGPEQKYQDLLDVGIASNDLARRMCDRLDRADLLSVAHRAQQRQAERHQDFSFDKTPTSRSTERGTKPDTDREDRATVGIERSMRVLLARLETQNRLFARALIFDCGFPA